MNLVEQFFSKVDNSDRYAYLENAQRRDSDIPQDYQRLLEVLLFIERIPQHSFFLKRGTVYEDSDSYISAEIGTDIPGLTYAYFNVSREGGIPLSVLARINERPLDGYSKNFLKGSSDSRTNNMLSNNQVVVDGMLVEARYIALCIDGIWYEYRNRAKGENLISSSVDAKVDLIQIYN